MTRKIPFMIARVIAVEREWGWYEDFQTQPSYTDIRGENCNHGVLHR